MRLEGRVAFVTGGNTGIGRAVCLAYAREGADVVIGWHALEDKAVRLAGEIESAGRRALTVNLDVTEESSVARAVADGIGEFGHIDVLVNNAGVQKSQSIFETSVDDFDHMLAVHVRGAFLCSREVGRHMRRQGEGRIINVCSQLGYIGRGEYSAYSAAKGGLIAFTRALARELAPFGILVNGVSPGLVDTGFDPLSDEAKREHARGLPLGRLGTPEDMISAFVFLACPATSAARCCTRTVARSCHERHGRRVGGVVDLRSEAFASRQCRGRGGRRAHELEGHRAVFDPGDGRHEVMAGGQRCRLPAGSSVSLSGPDRLRSPQPRFARQMLMKIQTLLRKAAR